MKFNLPIYFKAIKVWEAGLFGWWLGSISDNLLIAVVFNLINFLLFVSNAKIGGSFVSFLVFFTRSQVGNPAILQISFIEGLAA